MQSKFDFIIGMRTAKNTEDVTQLFKKGMPIDLKDDNGNTLLMIIVKEMALLAKSNINYTSIVNQLISQGVNLNARNLQGKTALSLAFECRSLTIALTLIKTKETILAKDNIKDELDVEVERVLRTYLEDFHAKQTTGIIQTLLFHGVHFTQSEGEIFYNKFLSLNLDNEHIYSCLRMIEQRYGVYLVLRTYLRNIDLIFEAQREPLYLALKATTLFADAIAKIISQYRDDPLENNYLMKSDIQKIFSYGQRSNAQTIAAILQKGFFRFPVVQNSSNSIQQLETVVDGSRDSQFTIH